MSTKLEAKLSFRLASREDFDAVRRITLDAYLAAGHVDEAHPYLRILADVERRAESAQVWLADYDGGPTGTVMLTGAGEPYTEVAREKELEFRMLAVDPAAQGNGVGRAMVEWILDRARALDGIDAVVLTSASYMVPAHRLYESLGFERMPERDWSFDGTERNLWVFRHAL
ncbi:GNAT superfamily N-acetyltransferase [Arthrobacter pigmenti]|uniref:GNAT superfamily N-acetyltransferase n=1 Tax=Arthrobacter pigmenti TaxID=271432 RepID=A0A846RSU6_9MICC|nr:GNAT family N-acetyltransferase [Arthrobacter pigmenti]NJC23554.1 GNAT superfamily N-acetyltransferase [Arthrobacter pigmenti]